MNECDAMATRLESFDALQARLESTERECEVQRRRVTDLESVLEARCGAVTERLHLVARSLSDVLDKSVDGGTHRGVQRQDGEVEAALSTIVQERLRGLEQDLARLATEQKSLSATFASDKKALWGCTGAAHARDGV
eukprot:SRR837773.9575.p1 GENE.SRR837773.9575~~SRR837773.9575.p1  ORF type:complete len:160 (-),score=42.48 SRR837773.9575:143-553(-)